MAEEKPFWLKTIIRLERAVGERVEAAVRSDSYFDVVTQMNRARARMTGVAEGVSREWLHLWNLPANTDIRNLREQLARMERRLNALRKEVADLEEDGKQTRQASAAPKRRAEPRQAGRRRPSPPAAPPTAEPPDPPAA